MKKIDVNATVIGDAILTGALTSTIFVLRELRKDGGFSTKEELTKFIKPFLETYNGIYDIISKTHKAKDIQI